MMQQIEQGADDMAIKLATLETPGKQQEWPKLMFYNISSYFGIIVLAAINRAHEGSRQHWPAKLHTQLAAPAEISALSSAPSLHS